MAPEADAPAKSLMTAQAIESGQDQLAAERLARVARYVARAAHEVASACASGQDRPPPLAPVLYDIPTSQDQPSLFSRARPRRRSSPPADERGPAIGAFARRLFTLPLPWTKMRAVHGLLGLARRFGDERVDRCCEVALAHDMLSLRRLRTMVERDVSPPPTEPPRPAPPARFLRPPALYALRDPPAKEISLGGLACVVTLESCAAPFGRRERRRNQLPSLPLRAHRAPRSSTPGPISRF
ncbi:MAG: hypothetical protein IPK80_01740 [Nannocystis sp.]|nr:hypothetical protein [Nannocystis sp.]